MQLYALLRQKAREGDEANTALLRELQEGSAESKNADSEWDISLHDANKRHGQSASRKSTKAGAAGAASGDQDQQTYRKAMASKKRGEDALVDHVVQKAQKHLKNSHRQEAKRQRMEENRDLDGIALSERNKRFNDRL